MLKTLRNGVVFCKCGEFWILTEHIPLAIRNGGVGISNEGLHCTVCLEQRQLFFDKNFINIESNSWSN